MVVPLSPTVDPECHPDSFSTFRQTRNDERQNQLTESQDSNFTFDFGFLHDFLWDFTPPRRSFEPQREHFFRELWVPGFYVASSSLSFEIPRVYRPYIPIHRDIPIPHWREEEEEEEEEESWKNSLIDCPSLHSAALSYKRCIETLKRMCRNESTERRNHRPVSPCMQNWLWLLGEEEKEEEEKLHWNIRRIYHIKDRPWSLVPFYLTLDPRRTVFHIKDRPVMNPRRAVFHIKDRPVMDIRRAVFLYQ